MSGKRSPGGGGVGGSRIVSSPISPSFSRLIAFLPFLSGLFGFDSGQMVKLLGPDRELY